MFLYSDESIQKVRHQNPLKRQLFSKWNESILCIDINMDCSYLINIIIRLFEYYNMSQEGSRNSDDDSYPDLDFNQDK